MRIAIASSGKNWNSKVSEVGGRSPFYMIFENKKLIKIIKNPFVMGGGAGFSVAQMLANENIGLVISQKFGPNMKIALREKNIKFKRVGDKTVEQILEHI